MPARSRQAPSFSRPSRQVPASPLSALFRPRHAALYGQDEWKVAGDTQSKNISLRPNPFADAQRLGVERRSIRPLRPNKESMMTRTLIRYKTKPDMADRNAELIAEVFEELKAAQPEGV